MSQQVFNPGGAIIKAYGQKVPLSVQRMVQMGYSYRQPIEWRPEYEGAILKLSEKLEYPYRTALFKVTVHDPDLDLELRRFAVKLDAYLESPNPLLSASFIWSLAAKGPEGASMLKKIKAKSVWKTFGTLPWEEDPEIRSYPEYQFNDIGDIFNYQYLPFWKSEDPEDYLESLNPCNPKEEALLLFRETFRSLLPDDVPIIKAEEILLLNRGSSALENEETGKTLPVFALKGTKANRMGDSIGTGLRCVIPKCPGDTRDAVILSLPSSNRVTWLDAQIMEVLALMDHHIHLRSNRDIQKRINKLGKKCQFFVHRDLKKEGLTKPRALLKIMLEELKEKFPKAKAFDSPSFYEDISFLVNGSRIYPKRGHGLGMANTLTTLMNITIYFMALKLERGDLTPIQGYSKSLSLNDDFVAGFATEEDAQSYADREKKVMDDLDLIFHPKKSFLSEGHFVIGEEYWPRSLSRKESYLRAEVIQSLVCVNIAHAKTLINSQISHLTMRFWEQYKVEIISHFGYEFFPEEHLYPFSCGGWVSDVLLGVNLDLLSLEKLPYNRKVYAGFKACLVPPPKMKIRKDKHIYQSPYLKIFGNLFLTDHLKSRLDVGDIGQIRQKYATFRTNPKKALMAWMEFQKRRLDEYKKFTKAPPYSTFVKDLISSTNVDYFPTEDMVYKTIPFGVHLGCGDIDPYMSPNPLLSSIQKANPDLRLDDIGEDYSLLKHSGASSLLNFSKIDWQKVNEEKLLSAWGSMFEWKPEWVCATGDSRLMGEFSSCFVNPLSIVNVCHMKGDKSLPVVKPEFLCREILIERESVFGTVIPVSIYPYLGKSFLSRGDLRSLFHTLKYDWDAIKDILDDLNEEVYEELHKPPEPEEVLEELAEETIDELQMPEAIQSYVAQKKSDYLWMLWISIKLNRQLGSVYGDANERARVASTEIDDDELFEILVQKEKLTHFDREILQRLILEDNQRKEAEAEDEAQAATWADSLWDE